mgnify:CR=1 FL=1
MGECKWMQSAICTNPDCMKGRYCPVPDYPGVCRFEEREKEFVFVDAGTLKVSEASEEDCKRFWKGYAEEYERIAIKKAIEMIDDYLREPNSIAEDWVMVLKLCRQALREKVKE